MGYDSILKVAAVNYKEFGDEEMEEYLDIVNIKQLNELEWPMGVEWHGNTCDFSDLFEKVSKELQFIHFKFYYFCHDYQVLEICEYKNGIQLDKYYVDDEEICAKCGFDYWVWNPKIGIENDITEYFMKEDDI